MPKYPDYWGLKKKLLEKYDGHCAYCGCKIKLDNFHVDHIYSKGAFKRGARNIPKGMRLNDVENLNPSCQQCNIYKSDGSLEWFRDSIKDHIKLLSKHPKYKLATRFGLMVIEPDEVVFYFEKHQLATNG